MYVHFTQVNPLFKLDISKTGYDSLPTQQTYWTFITNGYNLKAPENLRDFL